MTINWETRHPEVVVTKRRLRFGLTPLFLMVMLVGSTAFSQNKGADGGSEEGATSVTEADVNAMKAELLEKIRRVEAQSEEMKKENDELRAQLEAADTSAEASDVNAEILERLDSLEEAEFERIQEKQRELRIYGFADVQWYKFIYKKDTEHDGYLNKNNSFTVGHWHLYLEKQLSESFRFLGETRFLFQPYGEEVSYDSNITGYESDFARANTQAVDWVDAYYFDWGGISIQRLWIEYKLNDYFGVRAGNYLTPFGVWNVDHASTVVIPAHRPFIITAKLLPESQTGLNFFGRFFPSDSMTIDYALTVSNGRGPTAKLYDLDENKAVGLFGNFSYDGPVNVGSGFYLFLGEYTDSKKTMGLESVTYRTDFKFETVENYIEKVMSFHLKLEVAGVLIQGEYVRGLVRYKKNGRLLAQQAGYGIPDLYVPDHVQQATYGLLAYRLPFEAVTIRPFFMYEYQDPAEVNQLPVGHNFAPGINWQITPSVCWKVEGLIHRQTESRKGQPAKALHYNVVSSQLAVSY